MENYISLVVKTTIVYLCCQRQTATRKPLEENFLLIPDLFGDKNKEQCYHINHEKYFSGLGWKYKQHFSAFKRVDLSLLKNCMSF